MRKLYLVFSDGHQEKSNEENQIFQTSSGKFPSTILHVSYKLTWSHYLELLKISDPLEISFYQKETEIEKWNVRELRRQIKSMLFHRIALNKDKEQFLPKVLLIQQRLANEFFSPELINALLEDIRTRKYTYPSNYHLLRHQVTDTIRSLTLDELNGHPAHPQSYYDLVNTIRNNPTVFPEWQNTKTAELFSPKVFENKKSSGGYWF